MREYSTPKPEQQKLSDKLRRHSRSSYDRKLERQERGKVRQFHRRSKAKTTSGENGLEFFAVGLDDFLVVRWQKFTNTVRDTVTIERETSHVLRA